MLSQQEIELSVRTDLRNALWFIFNKHKVLTISTNWEVLDKTYGEVGGRFLEDFLLSELKANIDEIQKHHIIDAYAPDGRRTMEDVITEWDALGIPKQKLLISLKGHRAGSSSNPNLVSLIKAKTFFEDHPANCHFILVILHYLPKRITKDGFNLYIQEVGVYHLKDLHEHHFSLQTVGTGGQFLLSNIDNIQESYKTPQEFYDIICQKEIGWLERKHRRNNR